MAKKQAAPGPERGARGRGRKDNSILSPDEPEPGDPLPRLVVHAEKDLLRWLRKAARDPGYAGKGQVGRWAEELEQIRLQRRKSRASDNSNLPSPAAGITPRQPPGKGS